MLDHAPFADRPLTTPHADRLAPSHPANDEILAVHAAALDRGDPGYLDPVTGLYVMTAAVHAERGFCCERGCRHCPYCV
jgi:hypothetical protein